MTEQRRIVHCLRAPVGGLFRHVRDLVTAQAEMGHEIGLVCDSRSGGDTARKQLDGLAEHCALGVSRVPMSRLPCPRDITAVKAVRRFAQAVDAEILHGHGAKGGAHARLASAQLKKSGQTTLAFYTPHGGSLHYTPESAWGRLMLALERRLAPHTDGLVFESRYSAELYEARIGDYPCAAFMIPNGLWPHEFYEVVLDEDAADFLFVGELRHLKGLDVMLRALAALRRERDVSALIVGSGPDEQKFRRMAKQLGLGGRLEFTGAMPAHQAFARGRCLVVPSRAESFPYIVLEAAAARLPMILTGAGGMPEMVEGTETALVPVEDTQALAAQMKDFLENPEVFVERAAALQARVSERYTVAAMARTVCDCYERVLDKKRAE